MAQYIRNQVSEAERRLGELLESAPDAILEFDEEGRIVLLNRMAEQLFGYTREELLGQTVEALVPESLREPHKKHRSEYLIHPVTRPMGSGLRLEARRRDGSSFPGRDQPQSGEVRHCVPRHRHRSRRHRAQRDGRPAPRHSRKNISMSWSCAIGKPSRPISSKRSFWRT